MRIFPLVFSFLYVRSIRLALMKKIIFCCFFFIGLLLENSQSREWENERTVCPSEFMEPLKIVAGVFRRHFGIYFSFFAWLEPVENSYSCSHNYKASWELPSFKVKTQEALHTAENQQWHLVTADLPFGAPIWPLCWSSCSYCKCFLNCRPRDWPFPYHRTSSSERWPWGFECLKLGEMRMEGCLLLCLMSGPLVC